MTENWDEQFEEKWLNGDFGHYVEQGDRKHIKYFIADLIKQTRKESGNELIIEAEKDIPIELLNKLRKEFLLDILPEEEELPVFKGDCSCCICSYVKGRNSCRSEILNNANNKYKIEI